MSSNRIPEILTGRNQIECCAIAVVVSKKRNMPFAEDEFKTSSFSCVSGKKKFSVQDQLPDLSCEQVHDDHRQGVREGQGSYSGKSQE